MMEWSVAHSVSSLLVWLIVQMALSNHLLTSITCQFLFVATHPLVPVPGLLQALLGGRRRMGVEPYLELHLAALLPVRPGRVGLALADLLAQTAHAPRCHALRHRLAHHFREVDF